jgi:XisI protein
MEKLELYRTYIKQLLNEYVSLSDSDDAAEIELVFDPIA